MQIRKLTIENFRSIESMVWLPEPGVNCLIGPADVGKTSILDAIALLLVPYGMETANELDYRDRDIGRGFRIEAVLTGLPDDPLIQQRRIPPLRGWKDGGLLPLPDENAAEAALVCEVRGDASLDLTYSILPLDGDPVSFTPSLRRELSLSRISAAERANRDLRLGTGSLLARYFKGPGFGGTLTEAVRNASDKLELPEGMAEKLGSLKMKFGEVGLPNNLQFGLLPAIGWSLTGMVALATGGSPASAIPIANAGAGTRNLSLLELSAAMSAEHPIVVVDEPERGLEPYRQRKVGARLAELVGTRGQAFTTTHAPALLSAVRGQAVWHISSPGAIRRVATAALGKVLEYRPEAFFARVPIICEGPTELGLLAEWLPPLAGGDLASRGVELVDGEGQPHALTKLEAFLATKIPCAGFLDNEAKFSGRRETLAQHIPCFRWAAEKDIEDAVARHLPLDRLDGLMALAGELNGIANIHYYVQLRDELKEYHMKMDSLDISGLIDRCGEVSVRAALGRVMSQNGWFKTAEKGQALARYLAEGGIPKSIRKQINMFGQELKERFAL